MKNVAILGASDNPDRYAYLAQVKLQEHGYPVYQGAEKIFWVPEDILVLIMLTKN